LPRLLVVELCPALISKRRYSRCIGGSTGCRNNQPRDHAAAPNATIHKTDFNSGPGAIILSMFERAKNYH
jgi:hypothetical protein